MGSMPALSSEALRVHDPPDRPAAAGRPFVIRGRPCIEGAGDGRSADPLDEQMW
ncbi:hypothetical protein [Rhizobium azibense]|uniref:hypothetical protein n=1 Tax=Rhizobium azibense TaxID=1136135 RepID=UPI001404FCF0|nr:hypothetical protein [Rhizobium azibense]